MAKFMLEQTACHLYYTLRQRLPDVSMQREDRRSVSWVIWLGDSSRWRHPTLPSNSN